MKLPKPNIIKYKTTLPVSGETIEYRPFTVGEEKVVLLAVATGDDDQISQSVIQLISNTCSVDVLQLHPVDVEWLYLQLYIASESKTAIIEVPIKCTTEECPEYVEVETDLSSNIEVRGSEILTEAGYIKKKNGWLVPFDEESGIVFRLISSVDKDQYKVLWDAFVSMYVGEEVVNKEDATFEEFKVWVDELDRPLADRISNLFELQPWLVLKIHATCPVCGKVHTTEVDNITDFLG